jgi:putative ABC transport system permease protein
MLIRRDLIRRPVRNGILVLCVAAVVGMQVAAALIDRASRHGLEIGIERLGADLVAVPRGLSGELMRSYMTGDAALFYMDRALSKKIADFDFVERVSEQVYIKSLSGASCCSAWNVFLIGFDPKTDFTVRPWLKRHKGIELGPDQVLVGAAFDVDPGQALKFYGREFKVAGILDPTGMGLDTTVFIPNDTAYLMAEESVTRAEKPLEIKRDQVSAVLIKLKPEDQGGAPAYRAAYDLEMAIPEISVIQRDDLLIKVQKNLSDTLGALRSASYAVWPVTALLIGLVFAMAAHERMREIGLLRAMGATRVFVFRMILIEALMVAGCGMAIGLAASVGLVAGFSRLISMKLEVPFYWPAAESMAFIMIAASALALLTGVIAAMVPAVQSSLMEPYEAIRRGE